ncbi:UNVERIFIED_CONTAM: hypothetical protein Sradi_7084000 [Sesamum radiatum]|uniref:Reverse transcriptase domain-containing protein n=1 Tax=Sesamum radiatum TaxID=300843 RepID=A0AAW2J3C8_SESRA
MAVPQSRSTGAKIRLCLSKKDRKKESKFDEDRDRDIESVPRVTSDQYRRDATLYSKATTSKGIYYDETFGPVIKMATEDIKHVALRSPIGIYSTKVMPFGLKNAGATYQRAMTNIFKELLHHEVECYVDDLVLQLE